ncbi:hypothetical protein AAFF27_04825 [Xylophilus sp. GW821-FHT01B05]
MLLVRSIVFLLLAASAVCFALFAATGQQRYKRLGLVILKWTIAAGLAFFAVLAFQRLF